jgi:hypothetical protein
VSARSTVPEPKCSRLAALPGRVTVAVEGRLPQPDAVLMDGDKVRYLGSFPETVGDWNKQRPGRGACTDLKTAKPASPQLKDRAQGLICGADYGRCGRPAVSAIQPAAMTTA